MIVCKGCGADITARTKAERQRLWCRESCRSAHKRELARKAAPNCIDCGTRLSEGYRGDHRCRKCDDALRRLVHEVRLDVVQGCYEDGWRWADIAVVLGRRAAEARAVGPEMAELRQLGRIDYRNRGYGVAA